MSETKQQVGTELTTEQIENAAGGSVCDYREMITLIDGLTGAYESLIGFTSHVFERVSTSLK